MAKAVRTITARIPTYRSDRRRWRRGILASVLRARGKSRTRYGDGEDLEVVVLLYLKKGKRHDVHDVDNRLKDILDALQGRFGESKAARSKRRLIENDRQVCRVVMEKQPIPKMFRGDAGGRLLIRPYRPHRWPLQATKGQRLFKRRRRTT
jgi:hypothetical protein